jgi:Uma2 family endonuclease
MIQLTGLYVVVQEQAMTTETLRPPVAKSRKGAAQPPAENRTAEGAPQVTAHPAANDTLPDLPTYSLEVGYRTVYDAATQSWREQPLTLLELLYPTEDDVGAVKMAQSPLHDIWCRLLAVMLQSYLSAQQWLVTNDVLIHWGRPRAPTKSPDIAAMPGGRLPAEDQKSYRVDRDGPLPAFVAEITLEDTRDIDLHTKRLDYAAVGVKEYLIIDILTPRTQPWRLLGYRLEDQPTYQPLTPDEQGGLTFATVGLRFVAVGRERVEVYDVATGQRLLTPDELKAQAETEAARAKAEAKARAAAEAQAAALADRVRELEARYGLSETPPS